MAHVRFDSRYAPCAFLIVAQGAHYKCGDDQLTRLIQTDWDYPGVASSMGFQPCECGASDGTVDCDTCERTTSEMISDAETFLRDHEGEEFEALDEYLPY